VKARKKDMKVAGLLLGKRKGIKEGREDIRKIGGQYDQSKLAMREV
jgi:hypothetical protein